MVKKLIRYEFAANLKLLLPIELIVLGTAVLNRILQLFEADSSAYDIAFGSSVTLLVIAIISSFIGTIVICVRRYYKNMFSNEGYLTMAIPATPFQHIFSKCFVAFICELIAVIGALLAGCIAVSGELLTEILKAVGYLYRKCGEELQINVTLYAIEFTVSTLVQAIVTMLLCYSCLSLGQRAKKNKVAMSAVAFVAYYFIIQIIVTITVIVLMSQWELLEEYSLLGLLMENPENAVHTFFWCSLAVDILLGTLFYVICHRTLSRKLNLE